MSKIKQHNAVINGSALTSSAPAATSRPIDPMKKLLDDNEPQIKAAIGSAIDVVHFSRVVLTEVRKNPKLAQCTQASFLGSVMMAAQLRLQFNLQQAYLVPYYNNSIKSYECQLQIGYLGLIDLYYRHPLALGIDPRIVYENDEFEVLLGTDRAVIHKITKGNRGNPIGYYATVELKNGFKTFAFASKEEIESHRNKYAQGWENPRSAWNIAFDEMALKTVIKNALKYIPRNIEMAQAFDYDGAIKNVVGDMRFDINAVPSQYPNNEIDHDSTLLDQPEPAAERKLESKAVKKELLEAHREALELILKVEDDKERANLMGRLHGANIVKSLDKIVELKLEAEKALEAQAKPEKEEPKPETKKKASKSEPEPEPEQIPELVEDENLKLKQEIVEVFSELAKTGDYEIVHLNNSFRKQTGLQYDGTDWKAELLKADISNETLAKALEYWKDALDRINKRNKTSPAPAPAPDPEPADDSKMRQEAIELAKTIKEKKRRDDFIGAIGMVKTDDEIKFVMSAIREYKQEKEW